MIAIALLLLAYWLPGVSLVLPDEAPYPGALGLACSQELFGEVEGNAQSLCPEDNAVVIYPEAREDPRLFLGVLAHEVSHFQLGVNPDGETAYDRFREREAYEAGCRFSYVPMCQEWLHGN